MKGRSVAEINALVDAGVTNLGHNRAQEYRDTRNGVKGDVTWHFIGGLQSNKIRYLDGISLIHSVDRASLARSLGAGPGQWKTLIEVNVAGEDSKHGVSPDGLDELLAECAALDNVQVTGLMFVAPNAIYPEDVRWTFQKLRELRDGYRSRGVEELSMGMSTDFELAIQEGATMVRIGRALFGEE